MHIPSSSPWIGIDVSKDALDVAFGSHGTVGRVPNTPTGFRAILEAAQSADFHGIVCESTGIYHRGLTEFLTDHNCPISVVQPVFIKWFRTSGFNLAKTDPLDARLLARFGEERQPHPTFPKSQSLRALGDLLAAHRDLVTTIGQLKNRLRDQYQAPLVRNQRTEAVAFHEAQKAEIHREMMHIIASDPTLAERDARLQSVPGIGLITSATLLVGLPELGTVNRKKIAAMAGLAPYVRQSGTTVRKAYIRGGRAVVRSILTFAARSNRADPLVKAHRQQKKIACQHTSVADVATARWFLVILNAMMRDNLMWREMTVVKAAA